MKGKKTYKTEISGEKGLTSCTTNEKPNDEKRAELIQELTKISKIYVNCKQLRMLANEWKIHPDKITDTVEKETVRVIFQKFHKE